jgi:SAM-dependent methyltransferase
MDPARRWGSAEFTHTLAEVSWMASTAVLMHLNERATGDPARDWLSSWAHRFFAGDRLRVLVLGCGEGWLERAIAQWPFVEHIDAVDVSEEAVARARAAGGPKVAYGVVDLNTDVLEANAYDVIVGHSILHHVENLEHAFGQIERAMKTDATLMVNEYVGPNRFQFRDETLAIINELLSALPERLRRGHIEQTTYERKERPSPEFMIENDPSEAVRSEDLLPMIAGRFEVLESKKLGGTILMHLLYDIVQNFRFDDPHERALIEMMCALEGALVDANAIDSDFVILAARKKTAERSVYSRPLPPRPAAARNVERDPLGFGSRAALRGEPMPRPTRLRPWLLRILRVALASSRPRRANLIRERRVNEAIEQLRYALSGAAPFDWIRSRWSAHDDDAAIAAMLDAIEQVSSRAKRGIWGTGPIES